MSLKKIPERPFELVLGMLDNKKSLPDFWHLTWSENKIFQQFETLWSREKSQKPPSARTFIFFLIHFEVSTLTKQTETVIYMDLFS